VSIARDWRSRRRFWGKRQDKWCTFEDVFYAYKTNPPDEANPYERTNFAYFITTTKIGVGGDDQIRKIEFWLTFDPIGDNPPVEIVTISPTDETRTVGMITEHERDYLSRGGGLKGMGEVGFDIESIKAKLEISGEYKKGKSFEKAAESTYSREILITRSSGVSNTATWEFKQGNAAPIKGEYGLKVGFKIKISPGKAMFDENKTAYNVTPTIHIDDDDLLDNEKPIQLAL
jgi:hypothetical protein